MFEYVGTSATMCRPAICNPGRAWISAVPFVADQVDYVLNAVGGLNAVAFKRCCVCAVEICIDSLNFLQFGGEIHFGPKALQIGCATMQGTR